MEQIQISSTSPTRPTLRLDLPISVGLLVLTLALYWRVGHFEFINFDDGGYVTDPVHVQAGLTWKSIAWAFTTRAMANWHPLTWISYMADVQFLGGRPGAMHLENAIFHAINSILLYLLLFRLTGQRWPCAWTAAMFAWHPLHVESVAWISERKDVLSTFFMLLSIMAYSRYVHGRSITFYVASLLMFALGILCKQMIVTLPCVLLLLDFWPLRRLSNPATSPPRILARNPRNALIFEKLPMFLMATGGCLAAYSVQSVGHAVASDSSMPLNLRLANALISYLKYLQLVIAPSGLAIFYPHPGTLPGKYISYPLAAGCALLLVAITLLAIAGRRAMPWILVGWLWYLGTLVPVIGIVQVGGQAHADRYTYIPLIGIFIAVGWSAAWLARARLIPRISVFIAGIAAAGAALFISWKQIGYWQNSETVMRRAIEVVPNNYMAHANLAEVFDLRHESEAANKEMRIVLEIRREDPIALGYLAIQAADKGDNQQALDYYERSLRADQTSAPTFNNYGNFLSNIGRVDDAIRAFRRALELDPEGPKIYHNYALALARQGRVGEAIPMWKKALELKPNYTAAHFGLAQALLMARNDRQAIEEFRAALVSEPDRVDILANLAWVLSTNSVQGFRDGPEALRLAQRACELSNNKDVLAMDSLAAAQARMGQFQPAAQTAHIAADLAAQQNLTELSQQIARRISLYERGEPYTSGN